MIDYALVLLSFSYCRYQTESISRSLYSWCISAGRSSVSR